VWAGEEAPDTAAHAAADCLQEAALPLSAVTALLVTSEAPPLAVGLAAALHHRIGLAPGCVALEVGGACAGFLAALWAARRLLTAEAAVLLLAVEAPSRWLAATGEAAALFGDGAAACLLTGRPAGFAPVPLLDVVLEADGRAGGLLRVEPAVPAGFELAMDGPALAQRAVRSMARMVRSLARLHGLGPDELDVVMHAGNGRMPALLARQLGVPAGRVHSTTARTGNLGSASLPAARAVAGRATARRAVAWTAAGAGLQCGAALWGPATGSGPSR
jgi:3-oxoacyl-[acyl-carrier-protein] synthase-3